MKTEVFMKSEHGNYVSGVKLTNSALAAIEKIVRLDQEFPGIVLPQLLDHIDILADSARKGKYPLNNWLEEGGRGCSTEHNFKSIGHHILERLINGPDFVDSDSKRPPILHAAVRLMMAHTRNELKIIHPEDTMYKSVFDDGNPNNHSRKISSDEQERVMRRTQQERGIDPSLGGSNGKK
jgi:hypothetical protein